MTAETDSHDDAYWRERLGELTYHVMREKGTESPGSGALYHNRDRGTYQCAACGHELFSSQTKYDSGSGWPSFTEPAVSTNVSTRLDHSHGMLRTEVSCAGCGGHLGHVFEDGPTDRGGLRYCINSCALNFSPTPE